MDFDIIRLIVDFGLFILIWIVQLIIYPSFSFLSQKALIKWHHTYTVRIGFIVMPLMLVQLGMAIIQLSKVFNLYTTASLLLIIGVWLSTFLQFVPMHNKISSQRIDDKLLKSLAQRNWLRTFLWTITFLYSFCQYFWD